MAVVFHSELLVLHLVALLLLLTSVNAISLRQTLCSSWKLNLEQNNLRGSIAQLPSSCVDYVASYMTGSAYGDDSDLLAVQQAIDYAAAFDFTSYNASKNTWIFDIDETSLSTLPYFESQGFIIEDPIAFGAWMDEGVAPALPATLKLYNELKELGFYIFFLTGRDERMRNITVQNLQDAGYSDWEGLILR